MGKNYHKRDCSVVFDLAVNGFRGSQLCAVSFNGDMHRYWLSYALGELFGRFLSIVYGLYIEADDPYTDLSIRYETNDKDNPNLITDLVGKTTWDSEGGALEWTLSRAIYNNEERIVKIMLDYDGGKRSFRYDVKLDDLLYAVARAVTIVLKQSGICGYHFSTIHDRIDMTRFLMIKHYALTGETLQMKEIHKGMGAVSSSLEDEIYLLMFDM